MSGRVGGVLRAWAAKIGPRGILLIAAVTAVAYAFPGYLNYDGANVIDQGRHHILDDWHPPIMGWYWHLAEHVVRGPFLLLLIQISLFLWGLYDLLSRFLTPRRAALVASAILLFPPSLVVMAVVWKDAQMVAFILAGFALATRPRWLHRCVGIGLFFLACGVRDNGVFALPPLLLIVMASWGVRGRLKIIGVGAVLCVSILVMALGANAAIRVKRGTAWYRTLGIEDLAGMICYADPLTDDEVKDRMKGIELPNVVGLQTKFCQEYTPRSWIPLAWAGPEHSLFNPNPTKEDRNGRRRAFKRLLREDPHAYLTHRWQMYKEFLGLTGNEMWEPVCQTFAGAEFQFRQIHHEASHSWLQRRLGQLFVWLSSGWLWRPWIYVLLSLAGFGYAIAKRNSMLAAVIGSGLLYEAGFFFVTPGPDWRFSHWMVVCCLIGLVLVFVERFRARANP